MKKLVEAKPALQVLEIKYEFLRPGIKTREVSQPLEIKTGGDYL